MPVAGVLIAGAAAIGGAAVASNAADRQTRAITSAADQATQLQYQQWRQSRTDMIPWLQSGTAALGEINRRLGLNVNLTQDGAPIVGGTNTGSGATGQYGVNSGTMGTGGQPGFVQQLYNNVQQGGMNPDIPNTPTAPFPGSDVAQLSGIGIGNDLTVPAGTTPQVGTTTQGANPLGLVGTETPQVLPASVGPTLPGTTSVGGGTVGAMTGGAPITGGTPSDPEDRYGGFYASPGYQFRMNEGERALRANAAARGMLQSGDFAQALTRYGQDYASNEFNAQLNQLFSVAGLGQTAAGTTGAQGMQYANNAGNILQNAGQARASSYGTQANAWGNALGGIAGMAYNFPWGK